MSTFYMQIQSSHRLVITTIFNKWASGAPFAIHEVCKESGTSTSSVTRTLVKLVDLKMVTHRRKGFKGRHYRVVKERWPDLQTALQAYHWAAVLNI